MTALLSVDGLDAFYGRAQVLFGLSLELPAGQVTALLGRNGAGKSTALKAIMGLVDHRAAAKTFDGADLRRLSAHAIARRGLGYVPEERRVFKRLTVRENLEVGRRPAPAGTRAWTPEDIIQLFPNLRDLGARRGGQISGGEQQMLAIARALMANPRALLLDEPSEGLAPRIVEQMAATIRELKRDGLAVLLAEQNLAFAGRLADRAVVVDRGLRRFAGPMADLQADPATRRAYLSV
jgi:branched-chain amino acid transport system ATP-binding protein